MNESASSASNGFGARASAAQGAGTFIADGGEYRLMVEPHTEMRETLLPATASLDRKKVTWTRLRREALKRFQIRAFRPGQMEIIEAVFHGRDVFGVLPTGAGKSLCYQLPALFLPKPTIVVSPLIALMQDQRDHLVSAEVATTKLDSTLGAVEAREAEEAIAEGLSKVIYVTPERLEKADFVAQLAQQGCSLFVVDEAHCVSQWGHDFRPAYLALHRAIEALGRPPVLALTATATRELKADVAALLKLREPLLLDLGVARDNLSFEVLRTPNEDGKRTRLMGFIRSNPGVGIIYAATVRAAEELCEWLKAGGIAAERYHGKMTARARKDIQTRFMENAFQVIVATNAFGLGIDKPDVRFVVHYNFPDSLERYYQEAGRAGRDGAPARAALLYRLEDRRVQLSFLAGKYPRREDWLRVYSVFAEAGRATLSLEDVVSRSEVRERRAKVVLAELESAGVVLRVGRGYLSNRKAKAEALEQAILRYESRVEDDRERIQAVMRYAQSTRCRMHMIAEYFASDFGAPCARCDNCRTGAERPRRKSRTVRASVAAAAAMAALALKPRR